MKKRIFRITITIFTALLLLTCTNPLKPGLGDKVDLADPQLEITSHRNGDAVGGTFAIQGKATDDGSIKSVSLTLDSGSINLGNADIINENWSYTYDSTALEDGDHEFNIKVTDNTDKSVSARLLLTVDNNAPTVLVTSPSEYGIAGTDPEFNKSIVIKGEAADTTRVREVLISLYDESDTPVFTDAKATGTSSWYFIFNSETINSLNFPLGTTVNPSYEGSTLNGNFYFSVKAVDYSGNENNWFYHFEDILESAIDKSATPNVEDINTVDFEGGNENTLGLNDSIADLRLPAPLGKMNIRINPDSDKPRFTIINPAEGSALPSENIFSSPQRLSGFVEDDDLAGIDKDTLTLTIYEWGTTNIIGTPAVFGVDQNLKLSGNTWTYESSLVDGEYGVQLTVNDAGGNSGISSEVPFKVSSFAPVVNLDSPQQGIYIGKNSIITVSVTVVGASGDEVFIDLDNNGIYEAPEKMNILGGGLYDFDIDIPVNLPTLTNGDDIFLIRAGVNPNFGTASLQYTGDINDPTVSISYPQDSANINGVINVSGTASDNYLIESVYVWVGTETDPAALPTDYENANSDPAAALASGDWIIPTGTYNWTISGLDTTILTDNTDYTVFVKAFDSAENYSDLSEPVSSLTFTVNQESDRPVINLSNMVEGGSSNGLAQDASIIGIIEDDDLVDASSLEVRIDINNDGNFDGVDLNSNGNKADANESEQWTAILPGATADDDVKILSWNYNLLNVPQGTHSMQIRVHDTVSDGITNDEANNINYTELDLTEFIIDYGPPDLVITSPAGGAIFNSNFSIDGTATDPNNVTDVEISFNGGTTYTTVYSNATGLPTVNWSYNFTVDSVDGGDGYTTDGDYSYQIRATDASGGKTTKDRQLIVDAEPPAVAIELPSSGSTVNGDTVEIRGTATDKKQIAKVYLAQGVVLPSVPVGNNPASDPAYSELNSTYNWNYNVNSTTVHNEASDQPYYVSLVAVDGAGNLSIKEDVSFIINQGSDRPVISFNDIDKAETDPANNVMVGATTLTGLLEDDDLIDPSLFSGAAIEVNIDNGGWIPVSNPPAAGGKLVVWRHDISGLSEGLHHVKIRARDNKSNGTVGDGSDAAVYSTNFNWNIADNADPAAEPLGVPFILNLGPPSVSITAPANYSYHNTNVIISGIAADANGVDSVELGYDQDNSGVVESDEWSSVSNFTPGSTSDDWTYTFAVTGSNDGTYSYTVRAVDSYGSTGVESGMFTVDATIPTVQINQPDTGSTVNGQLTYSGTAGDNISLSNVYYYIGGPADTPVFPDNYSLLSGNYSWSGTIDTTPSGLGDGNFTLRVGSKDSAGNYSTVRTVNFTVDQASDRPVIDVSSILAAGTFNQNLLPASKQIGGTVTDDDRVDVSTIEYQLFAEDGTTLLIDWDSISGAPGSDTTLATWTHLIPGSFVDSEDSDGDSDTTETILISDGKYQIKFRAADTYDTGAYTPGGYGWSETGPIEFSIDTANPVTTFDTSNGGSTNTNLIISGTASDANGVSSVKIGYDEDSSGSIDTDEWYNANNFTPGSLSDAWDYLYTVDTSTHTDDGQFVYKIKVVDTYNKEQVYDRYITIDTTPATVVINQPASGADANGYITLRGTSDDTGSGVASVKYGVTTSNTIAPAYSNASGLYNWSDTYDSSAVVGPATYYLWVQVKDLAGNVSTPGIREFTIDQSSDKPVVEFSSITERADGGSFATNELPLSQKISGIIEDDDGVDASTVQYQLYEEDGTTQIFPGWTAPEIAEGWANINGQPSTDATFGAWSHTLSVADGKYQIRLRVADIFGLDDGLAYDDTYNWTETDLQEITVDSFAPTGSIDTLSVTSPYDSSSETPRPVVSGMLVNNSFTLVGTAADGNGVSTVELSTDGGSTFDTMNGTEFTDPGWSYTVPIVRGGANDGELSIVVRITDTVGKATDKTLTVNVDTVEPSTQLNYTSEMNVQAGVPTIAGPLAKIIGNVTDTGDISNVDRVDLFFVKGTDFHSPRVTASTSTGGNSIPTDSSYIISVDNRFEIDDDAESPGDKDGFLEGLRSKGTFDEWYAYIDSTILPDGPISLQQASYDASGNRTINASDIQVSNYPPAIDSLTVFGTLLTEDDVRVKLDGTGDIIISATDDPAVPTGIDTSSFELEIIEQYNRNGGDVGTLNTSYDTADTYLYSPDVTGTYNLDTSVFTNDYYYRVQARVKDVSANIVTKDFYMWVYDSSSDTSVPTLTIDELTQDNVGSTGHLDGATESNNDVAGAEDADVSGTINFTGTVYDDNSNPSVSLEISTDGGTNWSALPGTAIKSNETGNAQSGYTYDWTYSWDTSDVTGIAFADLKLRAHGTDGGANDGYSSTLTVDVVPYITDILTGYDYGLDTYIKRSALGRYTVASGTQITIKGYNLEGMTAKSVNIGGLELDPITGSSKTQQIVNLTSAHNGKVYVTTNLIKSQNNTNNNDLSQNQEISLYYPDRNDDRYISLWSITDTGFSGENAVMKPTDDGDNNDLVDNMDWMYTVSSSLYINSSLMTEGFTLSGGDFEYNSSGTRIWTFLNNSRWWGDPANDNWEFYGSVQWSIENPSPYNTDGYAAYNFNVLGDRLGLGNLKYNGTADLNRYHNIQIEVNGSDSSTDNYVAYYDSNSANKGIVYMGFTAGTGVTGTALNNWSTTITKTVENTSAYAIAGTEKNARNTGINDPLYNSDNAEVRTLLVSNTHASEDFKLAYDSKNDYLYMAWYDPADDALKLMYTPSPDTENGTWTNWSNGTDNVVASSGGTEVNIVIDPAGGIHLAYRNGTTKYLNYAYISDSADTTAEIFTVDALFNSGQYIGMSIRDFGVNDYRPIITSLSSAFLGTETAIRMAYPISALGSFGDGADSVTGNFTGDWEVIAIPAESSPQAAVSYIEMTGIDTTKAWKPNTLGDPVIGYNGLNMEEARYLDF